ncbi:hypothetical protein Tco_0060386 [Tanacetum coccineum]
MTSITTQQTKLDLELVPKENRLVIGKCNERIPRGLKPKDETFQVVLDALALTTCYHALIITADVPEMHQPWRTFAALIKRSLSRMTSALDKLHLFQEKKRLRSMKLLPECLTSPEMKESKAYKTYLCYATGVVPPKIARKFKKASPTKKDSDLVLVDEEPVDVAYGKGIELLSEVALTEKAQLKEVRKKRLREFHKTHLSGSGIVAKKPPSVEKTISTVTSEGTSDKPGVLDVTEDDSTESESYEQENESEVQEFDSEQDEESDDDNQEEEEVDQENESEDDEIESDEDKGMDDTTDQFDDDVDARLEEPTQTGIEVFQGEGADVEMNEA